MQEKKIKDRLIELIREQLKTKNLPKEIRIDSGAVIVNPAKFFESHLSIVSANEGSMNKIYGGRLSIALLSVGIDVHDTKRKAEKWVRSQE